MAKVFVVNDAGHDLSDAGQFGELVTLSKGKVNIFSTDRLIADFREKMKDMQQEDYLLFAGYAGLNAFAFAIALGMYPRVNLLIFDFGLRKYVVRTQTREQFVVEKEVNYNR